MGAYVLVAKVDQIVTKEVQLLVIAGSEEEATEKAREALSVYPEPVEVSGVNRIITNSSHYWIPKSVEFTEIKEDKKK
jgi:hypothetical protein